MPKLHTSTKHYQATVALRGMVNAMRPGEYLPTAEEIAATLGSSHGTVMRALTAIAEEGIIRRPSGRQRYVIAEKFDKISAWITMIRPDYPSRDIDVTAMAIYAEGMKRGWAFKHLCYRDMGNLDLRKALAGSDAAVLIPTAENISATLAKALVKSGKPVVVMSQHIESPGICNVVVDDYEVGSIAAARLVEKGHRRIAILKDQPEDSTIDFRVKGFLDRMKTLGVEQDSSLVINCGIKSYEDAQEKSYERLCAFLSSHPLDFSAIFTTSGTGAFAALRCLRERGIKIPSEVAVASYAGEAKMGPYMNPPLSAVEIDMEAFGSTVVDLLSSQLQAVRGEARRIAIKPHWAERESA